jgi:SSS family solute:Na+ symporter
MPLNSMDWIVIAGYLLINLLIGIYYRRRAAGNTEEFFVSGRNVSWWLAGTSMVATTFAADTPLFVCGVIATQGIAGNWLWWSFCIGGMMTVFFFARYWRRAQILTDVELTEIRYGGKPAAFLRGFKAIYLGLLMNCLILGWVTNAMVSIIAVLLGPLIEQGRVVQLTLGGHTLFQTTLGAPNHTALLICIFVLIPFTGIYTAIGGLWGVLVTDLFQFILKMGMVIVLAWVAVSKIGGIQALKLQLQVVGQAAQQGGAQTSNPIAFFPDFHLGWTTNSIWTLPLIAFFVYLGVQWWSAWYPGAEPGGGGYVAQRMFSAKDEKNSLGATLWFNLAHYALRPWPWILTALVALAVYSPGGLHPNAAFTASPQQGYVMVLRDYLPAGLRGIMVAAFLAAYMSTMGTQLNWGTSYLVNDLYRRFLVRKGTERHYVNIGKVFTILLVLLSGYVASQLTSISEGWHIVLNLGIGTGAVYILRWYWWRINAWSEIIAMSVAAIVAVLLKFKFSFSGNEAVVDAKTALITAACTTIAWVLATFLTPAESDQKLLAFYRRVHPTVYGWKRIARLAPELPEVRDIGANAFDWLMGCVLVYGSLFGIGKLVFQEWIQGFVLLGLAAVAGYLIFWDLSRRGWQTFSGTAATATTAGREVPTVNAKPSTV